MREEKLRYSDFFIVLCFVGERLESRRVIPVKGGYWDFLGSYRRRGLRSGMY